MFKSLYCQRRRIVLLLLALSYSVWAHLGGLDGVRFALKHEFDANMTLFVGSMGLAVLIVAIGISVLLTLFFPAFRRCVEVFAITTVLSDLFLRWGPNFPDWLTESAGSWIVFFVIYFSVATILEGNVLYRVGLRAPFKCRAKRTIRATPEAIWAAVAPDETTMAPETRVFIPKVLPRPEIGPDAYEAHYRMPGGLSLIQHHAREVWSRPSQFRYRFTRADGTNPDGTNEGTYEMICTPETDGTSRVTIRHIYPSVGLGAWLFLWLDDMGRSEMDCLQARLEGRRDWSTQGWVKRKVAQT